MISMPFKYKIMSPLLVCIIQVLSEREKSMISMQEQLAQQQLLLEELSSAGPKSGSASDGTASEHGETEVGHIGA